MFTQFTIHKIHALKLFQVFFFINYLISHFLKNLFFYTPFTPSPLIASLCNVYQCLTLYFERSENTPFSPPFHPLLTPLVMASRRVGKPPDGASCSPYHPQVLPRPLKPQGRQREASPFFHLPFAGERRCLVLWSVAGCMSFTS